MRRNVRTGVARDILRLAIIGVWAAEPRDVSLLHVLFYIRSAGSIEIAHRHRGRRPAGPGRRRHAADLAADGRGARRRGRRARRPRCGGSATATTASRSTADRLTVRARRAIVAVPPTLAGRIAYDPPLPAVRDGLSQRMAQGSVDQVHGDLRAPVLARPRPLGCGHERHRPGLGRLRQLAAGRQPRRAARLPRGQCRPRGDGSARAGAPGDRRRVLRPASSAPRPPTRSATSIGPGPRRSGRAAATAASCRPGPGATTASALRAPVG